MSAVDWVNGDSLIITRTKTGNSLFDELICNNLVTASPRDLSEVIRGQHISDRLTSVERELKTHEYLERYKQTESLPKDEVIGIARAHIVDAIKRKSREMSLPYRVARKIYSMIKKLR